MKFPYCRPLLGGAIAVLLAACDQAAPPAATRKPPPEVTVVTVHAESAPLVRTTVGLLASTRVAQVRARVAGIVLRQSYTEGTDVKRGQVLFQIDPAPLETALHSAQAGLAQARADASNAARIARRYHNLAARGLLASQDLDTAQANERTSAAGVKVARAKVEQARLNLDYATVTAPIAGHAGRALVTEGALVGQGEVTQLTTIEQIDPIFVNFSQPANALSRLQRDAGGNPGAADAPADSTVQIVLPDGTRYPRLAVLDFSAMAVDPRTGAISLRAVVDNPKRRLLPGMFVKLRVTTGHLDHAFLLPQATLLRDHEGAYVLLVDSSGKVVQRRVRTHGMTRTDWIVSGNLADGDKVVLGGLQKVKPGDMATAIPARSHTITAATSAPATKP